MRCSAKAARVAYRSSTFIFLCFLIIDMIFPLFAENGAFLLLPLATLILGELQTLVKKRPSEGESALLLQSNPNLNPFFMIDLPAYPKLYATTFLNNILFNIAHLGSCVMHTDNFRSRLICNSPAGFYESTYGAVLSLKNLTITTLSVNAALVLLILGKYRFKDRHETHNPYFFDKTAFCKFGSDSANAVRRLVHRLHETNPENGGDLSL